MSESEWVDYQACSREVRHVRLGSEPCRLCAQPGPLDRTLTSVGKFHWLCWQQRLDWADRYRPGRILDLTSDDFVTWATANPAQHREYLGFLTAGATFGIDDFPRPTRGSLLAPGQPPTTVILQPDGTIERPEQRGLARWGCDPAGLLVLYLDGVQYRILGQRSGLHLGRRMAHGSVHGEPVFLGLWSDTATGTAVRVTARAATSLRGRSGREFAEQDLFVGAGERMSVLGPETRVRVEPDPNRRRVTYRRSPAADRAGRRTGLPGRRRLRRLAADLPTPARAAGLTRVRLADRQTPPIHPAGAPRVPAVKAGGQDGNGPAPTNPGPGRWWEAG